MFAQCLLIVYSAINRQQKILVCVVLHLMGGQAHVGTIHMHKIFKMYIFVMPATKNYSTSN